MTITDFLICSLAASAVVDVWFNGSILAEWRRQVEIKADWYCDQLEQPDTPAIDIQPEVGTVTEVTSPVNACPCLIIRMLNCAYCMSHHTPVWVFVWYFSVSLLPPTVCQILRLPVYALAATRLMNVVTTTSGKPYQEPKV